MLSFSVGLTVLPPPHIALFGLDAIETLTAALVVITAYYAWQNRRMATEMRRSREALIRPKLAVDVHLLTPRYGMARATNVGQGPALDVDVELAFEPDPGSRAQRVVKGWRANVIAPGEHHDFQPPEDMDMDPLVESWNRITLTGRMRDASGAEHEVDEENADLKGLWERVKELGILWTEDPAEVTARNQGDTEEAVRPRQRGQGDPARRDWPAAPRAASATPPTARRVVASHTATTTP